MKGSFSQNTIISLITKILIFAFGFVSLAVISRVLGPSGRGIYSLIILIPSLILTFGDFGMGSGNVYFVGSKKYKTEDVASNSLLLAIILGVLMILVFWGLMQLPAFTTFITTNQIPLPYLWLAVLIMPVSMLLSFFQDVIRGKGEILNYNKISLLREIGQFIAVIGLIFFLGTGLFGAVLSNILGVLFGLLFAVYYIKKITKFNWRINTQLVKDSFSYGIKVYLANLISFLSYRLDVFLIAIFLNTTAVGLYSAAVSVSERLFILPGALATVLLPRVSELKGKDASELTAKVIRHTLFIMIIASVLLALIAYPLVFITFGKEFMASVAPLVIILPGIVAFGVGGVIAADLAGRGKPQYAVYSSITCVVINIGLNVYLLPKWGISGAAFASSIGYIADTCVVLWAFLKISQKSLSEVLIIKKEDFKDYLKGFSWIKN